MEENNELDNDYLDNSHSEFWLGPEQHALVKESHNDVEYYSIYTVVPNLKMLLCDDLEYSCRLSKKMIANGVKVFENFEEMYNWYQHSSTT
jgi:hypothetical protein